MPKLWWTTGFCQKCGRYIRHFGRNVACPQCGSGPPNQTDCPLETFGLDYAIGAVLGLTTARWAPARMIERLFWRFRVKPRVAEESMVLTILVVELVALLVVSSLRPIPGALAAMLAAALFYRILKILAIRTRIVMYDRRMASWRHGSYARSLILLWVNFTEVVLIYAILYWITWPTTPEHTVRAIDVILVAAAAFFGQSLDSLSLPSQRLTDVLRLSEIWVAFVLVTTGLGAVVNMIAQGREVNR